MVNEVSIGLNMSEAFSEFWKSMSPALLDKISPLVTIFKAIGIAILVYIIFLIIRAILRIKTGVDISKISKNVQEINEKLDSIVKKKKKLKNKSLILF